MSSDHKIDPLLKARITELMNMPGKRYDRFKLDVLAAVCSGRLDLIKWHEERDTEQRSQRLFTAEERSSSAPLTTTNCVRAYPDRYNRLSWVRSTRDDDPELRTLVDNESAFNRMMEDDINTSPPLNSEVRNTHPQCICGQHLLSEF